MAYIFYALTKEVAMIATITKPNSEKEQEQAWTQILKEESMLLKLTFPMKRHGQIVPVVRYFESKNTPTIEQLKDYFSNVLVSYQSQAGSQPEDNQIWREIAETEACVDALKHVMYPFIPTISKKRKRAIIPCLKSKYTESNAISIHLISTESLN